MKALIFLFLVFFVPLAFADSCGYPVYVGDDCNLEAFHPLASASSVVKWTLTDPDYSVVWDSVDDNGFNADTNAFYLNTGTALNKPGPWTLVVDFVELTGDQGNTDKKIIPVLKKESPYISPEDVNPSVFGFESSNTNIFIGVMVIILLLVGFLWWGSRR